MFSVWITRGETVALSDDIEPRRFWPSWAIDIALKLNEMHAALKFLMRNGGGGNPALEQKIDVVIDELRAFRREDAAGDIKMSAETQAAIDELKAEVTPMTDAVQAMGVAFDRLLAELEDSKDDPAQLREVIASFKQNREAIVAATLKGTSVPPPTPSGQ